MELHLDDNSNIIIKRSLRTASRTFNSKLRYFFDFDFTSTRNDGLFF